MVFASSKDAIRKALVGIAIEIQATDPDEVSLETGHYISAAYSSTDKRSCLNQQCWTRHRVVLDLIINLYLVPSLRLQYNVFPYHPTLQFTLGSISLAYLIKKYATATYNNRERQKRTVLDCSTQEKRDARK